MYKDMEGKLNMNVVVNMEINKKGGNVETFFSFIFLRVFVYIVYLCRPSEASTWHCVIPGGYPSQD